VIPFNVTKGLCTDLFYSWIKELWFAPFDMISKTILGDFKAMYIPYWMFEVDSVSKYDCMFGYSSSINNWCPALGVVSNLYKNIIVCASNCKEAALISCIEHWKMDQIQPFTLKHSEGTEVKPFTMEEGTAWRCAKIKLDNLNKDACAKKLRKKRNYELNHLIVETTYSNQISKRLFLPIYVMNYEYRDKIYRFVINGSSTKCHGERPYSASKLASLSLGGFASAVGMFKFNN
jgi:hypothetical protein